jgi:hypothetical protein
VFLLNDGEATGIELKQVISRILSARYGSALETSSWGCRLANACGERDEFHEIQGNVLIPSGAEGNICEFIHRQKASRKRKMPQWRACGGFQKVMIAEEAMDDDSLKPLPDSTQTGCSSRRPQHPASQVPVSGIGIRL